MKNALSAALIATALIAASLPAQAIAAGLTVKVKVEGPSKAPVNIGVFTSEKMFKKNIPDPKARAVPEDGYATVTFPDLKPGTYGVAVFQDKNGNGKMDKGLFGIPKEPYGFSNNPTIRLKSPGFKKWSFDYDGKGKTVEIRMHGK